MNAAPSKTTLPLSSIDQARERLQTRALVYEYLAVHAARAFRGTESHGPSKLLALPDGSQRPARLEHVCEIELELGRLAHDARSLMHRLKQAAVLVDPELVACGEIPQGPRPRPPPGEGVVEVGGRLSPTSEYDRRRPREAQRGPGK